MDEFLATERRTFKARLPTLLETDRDRFVLIRGTKLVGTFPTEDEALGTGYARFGVQGVFLVQRVSETNRVATLSPFFLA